MTKLLYPFLNAKKTKQQAITQYYEEPNLLGKKGLYHILDEGKKWSSSLTKVLDSHGAAIFPHTFLGQCGDQTAAVVHAVLDSGADQILALGVLHPMSESLIQARSKELNREDISNEPSRGILGPGLNCDPCWKNEFSLYFFKFLLDMEAERRGIPVPKIIERYPSLVNRNPACLPGIQEIEKIAKDSVIVATDDMCHHGIGYGVPPTQSLGLNENGRQFAKRLIEEGYQLLKKNLFNEYFNHWMNPMGIGDPTDTSIVLKYLLGDVSIQILDLKLVDVSTLFENQDSPSWVAATLVQFKK